MTLLKIISEITAQTQWTLLEEQHMLLKCYRITQKIRKVHNLLYLIATPFVTSQRIEAQKAQPKWRILAGGCKQRATPPNNVPHLWRCSPAGLPPSPWTACSQAAVGWGDGWTARGCCPSPGRRKNSGQQLWVVNWDKAVAAEGSGASSYGVADCRMCLVVELPRHRCRFSGTFLLATGSLELQLAWHDGLPGTRRDTLLDTQGSLMMTFFIGHLEDPLLRGLSIYLITTPLYHEPVCCQI